MSRPRILWKWYVTSSGGYYGRFSMLDFNGGYCMPFRLYGGFPNRNLIGDSPDLSLGVL